jgi:hypothetical protein
MDVLKTIKTGSPGCLDSAALERHQNNATNSTVAKGDKVDSFDTLYAFVLT